MSKHSIHILFCLTIVFVPLNLQACDAVRQMNKETPTPTPTFTYTPTLTPTVTSTVTLTPTITPSPTVTPNLVATQKFDDFISILEEHFDEEFVSNKEGEYYSLNDYSDSYTEEGYYRWGTYNLGYIRNFVLQTHVEMATANHLSPSTGCGVIYRYLDTDFADMVIVQQNGEAQYIANYEKYNTQYIGKLSNPADFELLLIVYGTTVKLFIDDKEALSIKHSLASEGDIGFVIVSGSKEDYGSHCSFSNIDFWEIKIKK